MVAYNIVFVGGTGVGKSSFINGLFYLEVSPTSNDFLEATEERKRCIAIQGFGEVLAILSPRQVFALPISHASKLTNVFIDWHNVNLHSESHFGLFEFSKKLPFQYSHPLVQSMSQDSGTFTGLEAADHSPEYKQGLTLRCEERPRRSGLLH